MEEKEIKTEPEKVEEVKEETKDLSLTQTLVMAKNAPQDIEKESPEFKYAEEVEKMRADLMKGYKTNKRASNIGMVIAFALLVTAIILVSQKNNQACLIAGYVVAGVALVGLITYYALTKNKFPNLTKKYIDEVTLAINRHVFNDQKFTEMKFYKAEKEDKAEVMADRVYKDISDVGSRNVNKGLFNKHHFSVSELATYKLGDKKKKELTFLGKYIASANDLHFEGRIIIVKSNYAKPSDLPTDIEGMEVAEWGELKIYFEEGSKDYENILGKKFIANVEKYIIDEYLLNVNIVIWGGRTAAYLSYEDAVVALPFDKPYDDKATEKFTGDLVNTLTNFNLLRK